MSVSLKPQNTDFLLKFVLERKTYTYILRIESFLELSNYLPQHLPKQFFQRLSLSDNLYCLPLAFVDI